MKNSKRKFNKRREKFWKGSGKFFLVLITAYLLYIGILKIIAMEKNINRMYTREDIEIKGNSIVTQDKILAICGFKQNDP